MRSPVRPYRNCTLKALEMGQEHASVTRAKANACEITEMKPYFVPQSSPACSCLLFERRNQEYNELLAMAEVGELSSSPRVPSAYEGGDLFKHRVKVCLHENKGKPLIGYEEVQFIKAPLLTESSFE